jgi:hypothetical protein
MTVADGAEAARFVASSLRSEPTYSYLPPHTQNGCTPSSQSHDRKGEAALHARLYITYARMHARACTHARMLARSGHSRTGTCVKKSASSAKMDVLLRTGCCAAARPRYSVFVCARRERCVGEVRGRACTCIAWGWRRAPGAMEEGTRCSNHRYRACGMH